MGFLVAADLDRDDDLDLAFSYSVEGLDGIALIENRSATASRDLNENGLPDECESDGSRFRRGDADALDAEINATWRNDPGASELYARLIGKRNAEMEKKIVSLMESGGTTFVVVGAAHMVGEGGLAQRLEDRGYRVEKR